ncbi:MAG: AEC family transporter [Alphaproteobacteria bacterium]|nr:AEC family transporter [Alphaproteobacteria bacterium]
MIDVIAALVPVFAIIAIGAGLHALKFMTEDGWRAVERITYFVLFPCFLFGAIAFADFKDEPLGRLSLLLAGAMIVMAAIVYPFRTLLALDGPAFTSVFQGAVRWNSYVALGAIAAVLGPKGLALAAIAVAIMVPLANALCVIVLMRHTGNGETGFVMLAKQLARNPLILACLAGIAVQALGIHIPKVASATIDMVGKAALPLGLLAVGASLDLGHARARPSPIVVATLLKLVAMPLLMAAGLWLLGVESTAKTASLICAAVPGASSSYILARQLGGDAPLMANITTVQTLSAMLTMPVMLWVLG